MRKIITTTFVTLDGVLQAPGGASEDTTGGFAYGGWQQSFPQDAELSKILSGFFAIPFELLLGRITYDIFAGFWPTATTDLEVAAPFNRTKKYVVSHEPFEPSWNNSTCITGDVVAQIQNLKEQDGPDLWVWGSGNLIQTLLKHHLVDRMHLWIHPITIGTGKKLFAEGTQPETFKLTNAKVGATGLIFATYEPRRRPHTAAMMRSLDQVYKILFASVYPLYIAKAERKGRTKAEVDEVIRWLTGYSQKGLEAQVKKRVDLKTFFAEAPKLNPARRLITGVVCGVRVEEIAEKTMREIRYMDKLIDELAKGRAMEKILRK